MGFFADYIEGVSMRKNPQLLQRKLANMDARDMRSAVDEMYGNAATPQQTEGYAMDDAEMFLGEQPISGLETITQEAQEGSGLIGSAGSPEESRYLTAQKVLGMSGNRQGLAQQANLMSNMQNSVMSNQGRRNKGKGSWSTFEVGAGNGKKQRAYFNEQGQLTPVGEAYRPFAPQAPSSFQEKMSALNSPDPQVRARAKEAMRNQWISTDTGSVNAATGEFIDKNIVEGAVQKGYGGNVSKKLENYGDYVKQSDMAEYELNRTLKNLDQLEGLTDNWTTGIGGTLLSYIPQTDAKDWDEKKKTVLSSLGLGKMMELKAASSTGSTGFGALSERELEVLQTYLASLNQAQSPKAIKQAIGNIRSHMGRIMSDIKTDRTKSAEWYRRNTKNQNQNRGGRYGEAPNVDQAEGPRPGLKWK